MTGSRVVAVVLAGGESRRFGSDKLVADLAGRTLLERAVEGLPPEVPVIVVGPVRPLGREVEVVREEPAGGGPAAALVAGLRRALHHDPDLVLAVPGDAPAGGRAALVLAEALIATESATVTATVGVDSTGRDQVLQLALRPAAARQLIDLAGSEAGRDQSVRRLVAALDPAPHRVRLDDHLVRDVDTVEELIIARTHLRNPGHA